MGHINKFQEHLHTFMRRSRHRLGKQWMQVRAWNDPHLAGGGALSHLCTSLPFPWHSPSLFMKAFHAQISFCSYRIPVWKVAHIIVITQLQQLRFREVQQPTQGHTARRQEGQGYN